jgi:hypothetical protein
MISFWISVVPPKPYWMRLSGQPADRVLAYVALTVVQRDMSVQGLSCLPPHADALRCGWCDRDSPGYDVTTPSVNLGASERLGLPSLCGERVASRETARMAHEGWQ